MESNFASTSTRKRFLGDLIVILLGVLGLLGALIARAANTTTTTLTLSSSSVSSGTVVTFTATVSPATLGTVTFCNAAATYCENSAIVGTAQLNSAGTAIIKIRPGIGSHSYIAIFSGIHSYSTSTSAAQALTVTGTTTTAITSSGSAGNYTLTGTVVGLDTAPTGTVNFSDTSNENFVLGSATLGTATLAQAFASPVTLPPVSAIAPFVATGDFNGDGIPDLAIASGAGNTIVNVLLGNGDGTFQAASPITVGSQPFYIAVGDFNNDGNLDLAVANWAGNSVSILLGNGAGGFTAAQTILTGTGTGPVAIVTADFNGDGNLDLAVANNTAGKVGVYLGNGDGTFTLKSTRTVGTTPFGLTAFYAKGEVNLAVANSGSNTVSILLGSGNGTFTAGDTYTTLGQSPYTVIATDVNNDGIADLVFAESGANKVGVMTGNGDGTFASEVQYAVGTTPYRLAVSDVNSDGNVDLIVANHAANTIGVLLGNGNGTFQQPQVSYPGVTTPYAIAIADFNGDGAPDLAVANQEAGTVSILLNSVTQTATTSISDVSIAGTGTHQIDANYSGDSNFDGSTSSSIPLSTSLQTTHLTLTTNQSMDPVGEPLVLTAALSPSTEGIYSTTGEIVTFKNGTTTLGTDALNSLGVATLALPATTTTPPAGAQASYPGDTYFSASSSNLLTSAIVPVLTVRAQNASYTSGTGNLPSLSYSISGFINGDTQTTATTGVPSLSTTAMSNSPAGPYPITISQGNFAAPNYSVVFVNSTLTIASTSSPIPNIQGRWEFAVTSGDTVTQFNTMGQSTFSTYLLQTSGTLTNNVTSTTDNVACDTVDDNNVTVTNSSIDGAGNVKVDFTVTLGYQNTFDYVFTGVLGTAIGTPEVITGTYQRSAGGCTNGSLGTSGTPDGYFTATYFPDFSGAAYQGDFEGPDVGSGPTEVPATFTLTTNADQTLSGTVSAPALLNAQGAACLASSVTIGNLPGGYIPGAFGAMVELFGTDSTGTTQLFVIAIATNPDGSAAAVGEDDPTDGSNGTINDGTNNAYTAFYIISGGPCDGFGGGDAPFKLITKSAQPPKQDPPRKHHWDPYPRFRRLHRHGSDLAHRR